MIKNLRLRARIIEHFGLISDFAEAVGDNISVVSRIVNNRAKISPERAEKWSSVLGADLLELFDAQANR
ncbi:MAG: hypothetical protein H6Q04_1900 [Acidobacteria bacterium]|jgi:transcriptional regulator with XRE-family HTH domain|nr:hypothetical protein [Acidobacteriota bacterium]